MMETITILNIGVMIISAASVLFVSPNGRRQ